jgi:hypothetical protein
MSTPIILRVSKPTGFFKCFVIPMLSRSVTHVSLGAVLLLLDLFIGRFLLFPFLFVVPVALSAWYCSARLAYSLAVLLPVGRLLIATFLHVSSPFPYIVVNSLIRVAVLMFIAFLASRAARQTKELQERVDSLVTICAWSHTVEYQGEWISFEEYLLRRFNVNTSHGISPAEKEKIFKELEGDGGTGLRIQNEAQMGDD